MCEYCIIRSEPRGPPRRRCEISTKIPIWRECKRSDLAMIVLAREERDLCTPEAACNLSRMRSAKMASRITRSRRIDASLDSNTQHPQLSTPRSHGCSESASLAGPTYPIGTIRSFLFPDWSPGSFGNPNYDASARLASTTSRPVQLERRGSSWRCSERSRERAVLAKFSSPPCPRIRSVLHSMRLRPHSKTRLWWWDSGFVAEAVKLIVIQSSRSRRQVILMMEMASLLSLSYRLVS